MNYKVVIDSGHGGTDPGASGNGIIEKDLNLQISKYMQQRLNELGVENSMTRNDDETLSPAERTKLIQSFYGTGSDVIVVSNHINAGGGDGAEVIYALRNNDNLSSLIANELSKTKQNVRKYYQRRLPSNPSQDYYYIMRDTPNNETIIVEYGFLDSTGDDVKLLKNDWKELTEAVVKALAEYMNVPYKPSTGTGTPPTTNPSSGNYMVKAGDTLWSIARENNTTVDEIKKLNNLTTNSLSVGQTLILPGGETNESGEIYIVKAGDSLYAIAMKHGLTVDELKRLNNLTSNNLSIGQELIIKPATGGAEVTQNYTVKAGDSLYRIALAYQTTVDELMKLNNLTSAALSIGQVLKVPNRGSNEIIHTVVAGDSLYSIALKYNTTIQRVRELNNLTSDLLSIGQKLKIA